MSVSVQDCELFQGGTMIYTFSSPVSNITPNQWDLFNEVLNEFMKWELTVGLVLAYVFDF